MLGVKLQDLGEGDCCLELSYKTWAMILYTRWESNRVKARSAYVMSQGRSNTRVCSCEMCISSHDNTNKFESEESENWGRPAEDARSHEYAANTLPCNIVDI